MRVKMKIKLIFIASLFLFSCVADSQDKAMDAFKNHEKVKAFLADKSKDKYWIKFEKVELGGICGIVGCQWRQLVSMVVTSKMSNAPSVTFLGVVEGVEPDRGNPPSVRFVDLKDMDINKWNTKI